MKSTMQEDKYKGVAILLIALNELEESKPNNGSEIDKRYEVAITKMKDVITFFNKGKG